MEKTIDNSILSSKMNPNRKRRHLTAGMPIVTLLADSYLEVNKKQEKMEQTAKLIPQKKRKIIVASMPTAATNILD